MKKILKNTGLLIGLFGISFSIAFMSQYKKYDIPSVTDDSVEPEHPITNQQKLLANLMTLKTFDIKAEVEAMTPKSNRVGITFDGVGDVSDLQNIQLEGDAIANLDGNHIPLELSYLDSTAYFAYRDSRFRIDTTSVFDFVEKLPTIYGIELEVPDEIKNLNLEDLLDRVNNMEDKKTTPQGDLCFKLSLNNKVDLYIKTDELNNFKGIRTDHFYYNETRFYLDITLNKTNSVEFTDIESTDFQDFKPAFTIFDGIYNLTKKNQNTIKVDLDLKKKVTNEDILPQEEVKQLVKAEADLTYDFNNSLYSLDGKIIANEKEAPFNFALYKKKLYAKYSDLKISIQIDSVTALLNYAFAKIGDQKIEETINQLLDKFKNSNLMETINNVDNMLGDIVLTESDLNVDLTPENAGINDLGAFTVALHFDDAGLQSLAINNLSVKDYFANVVLTFQEYKPFIIQEAEYANMDQVLGLIDVYENYMSWPQQKFQLAFDGAVKNDDLAIKPIKIDGNIQFVIDPDKVKETDDSYGYGYVNVVDRNEYKHNIKADMKSKEEILFNYNDAMNGKAKIRTMKELLDLVMDLVNNPDEHFNELFGEMLQKVASMPIKQIMDGDYLQLLTTNLINRLETGVDDNGVYFFEVDIALDVINLSDYGFTLRLEYENKEFEGQDPITGETTKIVNPIIDSLKVSNCKIGNDNIEFNLYLRDYETEKDSTRLDPYLEYIDFSDIKVLLQLGINTSKFNYYHFTANATLNIAALGGINFDIPLDIKLHSQNGDIKVSIDFTNIPIISLFNGADGIGEVGRNYTSRKANLYYHDKMFYLKRVDNYETGLFFKTQYETVHTRRFDLAYMQENILNIMLKDIFGAKNTITSLIKQSTNNSQDRIIHYEKILKGFTYNSNAHYFFFDIDIGELAKNDNLSGLTLKVRTDENNEQLEGLDVHLGIAVGITINIDLALDISDRSPVADDSNKITALESYIQEHANDNLNEWLTTTKKL